MKNKKAVLPALVVLIIACIGAAGVNTFLGPCVHEDGSFGPCHWAGRAVFAVWLLLLAESALLIAAFVLSAKGEPAAAQKNCGFSAGLYAALFSGALAGIVLPGGLIGLCSMATMRCVALMKPAMTILFLLTAIASAAGFALSLRCAPIRSR